MKNKVFRRFKIFFFLLVFGLSVFGSGYIYLDSRLTNVTVSDKTESVPFYSRPENSNVLFDVCGDKILINLDFKEEILNVIYPEQPLSTQTEIYGYRVNFTLSADYELVGYLADLVGGIELKAEDETLRYTGVQITEMLEFTNVSEDVKREIAEKIIFGIAESGFTKENLLYIIQNSETDLKFYECFGWVEFIPKLCKFSRIIN